MPVCTCRLAIPGLDKEKDVAVEVEDGSTPETVVTKAIASGLVQFKGVIRTEVRELTVGGEALAKGAAVKEGDVVRVVLTRAVVGNYKLPRDVVMQMYARENELRTCEETQRAYTEHDVPFNSDITRNLQVQLLKEYDLPPTDEGLRLWQTQRWHHRDDEEVRAVPLYIKYDVSSAGTLKVGDPYTDCRLVTVGGEPKQLADYTKPGRPLVIIAGSYS